MSAYSVGNCMNLFEGTVNPERFSKDFRETSASDVCFMEVFSRMITEVLQQHVFLREREC